MSLPMVLRQLTTYFPSDIGTTFSDTTITLSGAALIPGVPAIPVVPPFRSFRHFVVLVIPDYRLLRSVRSNST
jgi:hypothetical protein